MKIGPLISCTRNYGLHLAELTGGKFRIPIQNSNYKIPFSSDLCTTYLFIFRGSQADIKDLYKIGGASGVIHSSASGNPDPEGAKNEQILQYLVRKGLDVNASIVGSQTTALHLAVGDNRDDLVKMLLRYGADINVKDKGGIGLTPLELVLELEKEDIKFEPLAFRRKDRHAVIALLQNAK